MYSERKAGLRLGSGDLKMNASEGVRTQRRTHDCLWERQRATSEIFRESASSTSAYKAGRTRAKRVLENPCVRKKRASSLIRACQSRQWIAFDQRQLRQIDKLPKREQLNSSENSYLLYGFVRKRTDILAVGECRDSQCHDTHRHTRGRASAPAHHWFRCLLLSKQGNGAPTWKRVLSKRNIHKRIGLNYKMYRFSKSWRPPNYVVMLIFVKISWREQVSGALSIFAALRAVAGACRKTWGTWQHVR